MPTPERWQQIEKLYHAAVTLPPEEREALLAGADADLRGEVESLLRQEASTELLSIAGLEAVAARAGPRQVGPYLIEGALGAGGMGEVFRATDTRLNRAVAIKFCDARFISRFQREAQAISALNHPNICTLYDVGPNYLVMELIEGQTLSSRIRQGPLPFDDVVQFGAQIAGALAEAHAVGIVHRDLKPGNVMITRHGAKVLDFGLAKLSSGTDDGLTRTDAIMGTPAYMAPEQVQGKPADARADLFALGLILHEMAAGKLPFPGVSLGTMLANDDSTTLPLPSKVRPGFPAKLDRLLARLLAAHPANRPGSAAIVRDQLLAIAAPKAQGNRLALALAASLAIALAAGVWWWVSHAKPAPLEVATLRQIAAFPGDKLDPAFSPNGTTIAFSWHDEKGDAPGIYLMPLAGGQPRRLTQTPNDDVSPVWDGAGKRIAFLRLHNGQPSEAMYIAAEGGTEKKVRDVSMPEYLRRHRPVLSWTHDGSALVIPMDDLESIGTSLYRLPLDSSSPRRLIRGQVGMGVTAPVFSADGNWLAYRQTDPARLFAQRMGPDYSPQGEPLVVVADDLGSSAVWSPDASQLWFYLGSRIVAWNRSTHDMATIYTSPTVLQGLTVSWKNRAAPDVVFSVSGSHEEVRTLDLAEGGRRAAGPSQLLATPGNGQAISPDGRWIAYSSSASGTDEIWIASANGDHRRQITHFDKLVVGAVDWSPDGRHLATFARNSSLAQLYVVDLDPEAEMAKPEGAKSDATVRQVTHAGFTMVTPMWSTDAKYLYAIALKSTRVIRVLSAGGEPEDLFEGYAQSLDPERHRIYYGKPEKAGLFSRSLAGDVGSNPEQRILTDFLGPQHAGITKEGVFYQGSDPAGKRAAVRFFDFHLAKSFDLAPPTLSTVPNFVITPDGHRLLWTATSEAPGSLTRIQLRQRAD